VSKVWILKTNYVDPTFRVEFASQPGIVPTQLHFQDIHELRQFLDSRRLPIRASTEEILNRPALTGHVELQIAEPAAA